MKKFFTLLLTAFAMGVASTNAQDFVVLTTPENVLKYSTEDVAGAKAAFQKVVSESTNEEDITSAMQEYEKNATPAPGYAFDMTFQLIYPSIQSSVTMAELAKGWFCDVEGVTDIKMNNSSTAGYYLRVNDTEKFMQEDALGKYVLYQKPILNKGKYLVTVQAYAQSAGNVITLSAGETDGPNIKAASKLSDYSLYFSVQETKETKIGARRNNIVNDWSKSPIKTIAFNNMKLYKVSSVIVADGNATEGLAAATGVDVLLQRTFDKDHYHTICLPFIIENWRDVFTDLLLWNDATETSLNFNTVRGANTQARKPYLVKMKEEITEDNYIQFKNVNIESENPGSWTKDGSAYSMSGNWGTMPLPANAYYIENDKFTMATRQLPAFAAYMTTTASAPAAEMEITVNGVSTGIKAGMVFGDDNKKVDVWSIDGKLLKHNVNKSDAINGLVKGLYIVDGKKIVL